MAEHYYAVNKSSISGTIIEHTLGPYRAHVREDSDLVIFSFSGEEVYFTGTSRTTEVHEREQDDHVVQTITIEELRPYPEERRLSVLAGSLEKVYRFLEPSRHFQRRPIIRLTEQDYVTIAKNTIDVYRSTFRILFESLPVGVQADFIRLHLDVFPWDRDGRIHTYRELAPLLVKFYRTEVSSPLVLLRDFAVVHEKFSQRLEANTEQGRTLDIRNLVVGAQETRNFIGFGSVAQEAAELMRSNGLFAETLGNPMLLQEAEAQLRDAPAEVNSWNDPISW